MADKKPRGNQANLRPPWKPGESGNPSGRPKRRPITDSYIEMAGQEMPPEMCKQLGMKTGSTFAKAVARGQFIKAMKGEVKNASEIREAIEGRATQHPTDKDAGQDAGEINIAEQLRRGRERALAAAQERKQNCPFCGSRTDENERPLK